MTSADQDTVLEAARAIRPFLAGLLGSDAAAEVDREFADGLAAAAAGEQVCEEMLARLRAAPATRRWWLDFTATGLPPEVATQHAPTRSTGVPGRGEILPPPRYACPRGDYVWYRGGLSRVPICPTHGVRLEASPGER
jgi:hypothetical protein